MPLRVLHLEDSPLDAELIQSALEAEGLECDVVHVKNREQFEAALMPDRFDVILCDYALPHYNGFSALEFARRKAPAVPFILLSGTLGEELAVECLKSGATDYILKQRLNRLAPAVRRAVREAGNQAEKKRAEEALDRMRRRSELILDSTGEGICGLDLNGRITFVNSSATNMLGYKVEELIDQPLHAFLRHTKPEGSVCQEKDCPIYGAHKHGVAHHVEDEVFWRKDGTSFPAEYVCNPIWSDQAELAGAVVTFRDITERRRADQVLRSVSLQKLGRRKRRVRSDIVIIFLLSVFVFAAGYYYNLFEEPFNFISKRSDTLLEEMIGTLTFLSLSFLVFSYRRWKESRVEVVTHRQMEEALRTLHGELETRVQGRAAELVKANENLRGEIAERKRAEQRLAGQYAAARVLAECATLDEMTGKLLKLICEHLGWSVGQLWMADSSAKVLRWAEVWHPLSSEFVEFVNVSKQTTFARGVGLPGRVWASGRPAQIRDVTGDDNFPRNSAAAKVGLHASIALPVRRRDEIVGVLEFFSNEIREPEPKLLQMIDVLVNLISQFLERTQLEEQFRQSQKMEAVGQLAGGIAHDFNNILGCIVGYTELAAQEIPAQAAVQENLREVLKASHRAKDLVQQILTFSRRREQERKPIQLQPVIQEALQFLRASLPSTIDIRADIGADTSAVLADATQIHQIIMNMATNAAHAMSGRGQLAVKLTTMDVDADFARLQPDLRVGRYLALSVSDTGCGMDHATLQRIFEPFFTTKAPGEGTGLGLAVIHGIMKSHEGAITVSSELGKGTAFHLYFPAHAKAATETAPMPDAILAGNGERILLVDDEAPLAMLGRKTLERAGYHVTTKTNSVEALAAFRAQAGQYDLVVTDLTMPNLTGPDLARELLKLQPGLPIILATGFGGEMTSARAQALGIRELIMKPVTAQSLSESVHRVLTQEKGN